MRNGPTPTRRDRRRAELPVDRLRRRHQADQGQDRHFRSLRRAAQGKELETSGLIQFPMVMGGIVPVVNIEGIKPGELTIDGPTLARIFMGEIKTWNDPAIAKLNPRPSCPRRRSPSCIAPTAPARPSISPYYLSEVSRSGSRRWASTPRSNGRWGSAPRATKASPTTWPDQGFDRLRRICLRQAEQADLHQDDQQGRQGRCADLGDVPGGRRQRRLGIRRRVTASFSPISRARNPGR